MATRLGPFHNAPLITLPGWRVDVDAIRRVLDLKRHHCCVAHAADGVHAKKQKKNTEATAGDSQVTVCPPTVSRVQVATLINICLSTYHPSCSSAGH